MMTNRCEQLRSRRDRRRPLPADCAPSVQRLPKCQCPRAINVVLRAVYVVEDCVRRHLQGPVQRHRIHPMG